MRSFAVGAFLLAVIGSTGCDKPGSAPPPTATMVSPALKAASEHEIGFVIERDDNGRAVPVTPNFEFRSGDRFRLRFRTDFPAYVYVVNRGAGQATCRLLYPVESEKGRNPLKASSEATVPIDTEWLRLDQTPGNEYLTLIASTVILQDLQTTSEISRDRFDSVLANIDRAYQPVSSRRYRDGDMTVFSAARDGDLALIIRLALQHD